MGNVLGPEVHQAVLDLYDAEQRSLLAAFPASVRDIAYGPDPRHRLDVYCPKAAIKPVPVIVWVHGGGFMRGDKGDAARWENAHAGSMAAREGYLGIVMNYRLAPQHRWPSGADDLTTLIAWVKREAGKYGGDSAHIVLMGTSAGAAHVAGYIKRTPGDAQICAAVLLSGLYGVTPLSDVRDFSYFGDDRAEHGAMMPLEAMVRTGLPLFLAFAEFDPVRFQEESLGLLSRRLAMHGRLPRAYLASGHNHFSLAYHLGTGDTRLSDEIWEFVAASTA